MSDVPSNAFREILSRVPPEFRPTLRCVCKEWRRIIDDPAFIDQLDGGERLIIYRHKQTRGGSGKLYSLYLSSVKYSQNLTEEETYATNVKNLSRKGVPPLLNMPVPSCHGLILLSHYELERTWTIWNPLTKDFLELPPYNHLARGRISTGGIGYDDVSGAYKVVRISGLPDDSLETLLYSVKSGTWSKIQDYLDCIFNDLLLHENKCEHGVFVNGALHWFTSITAVGGKEGLIMALDLGTEKYRQIPGPLDPPASSGSICMDASGGCLFLSYFCNKRFDIWMLNEQGGENIWIKLVSLKKYYNVGMSLRNPQLISYSKGKKEVVIRSKNSLLWYDVEHESVTKVSIQGVDGSFSCQAMPLSFIRLAGSINANGATASNGSLKRKRTSSGDRLALKLTTCHFRIPDDSEGSFDPSDILQWMKSI